MNMHDPQHTASGQVMNMHDPQHTVSGQVMNVHDPQHTVSGQVMNVHDPQHTVSGQVMNMHDLSIFRTGACSGLLIDSRSLHWTKKVALLCSHHTVSV